MGVVSGLTKLWHTQSQMADSRVDPNILTHLGSKSLPLACSTTTSALLITHSASGEGWNDPIQKYKSCCPLKGPVYFFKL